MKKKLYYLFATLCLLRSLSGFSQESFYRVYQFETPLKGHLELTNWTTFIHNSDKAEDYFGKTALRNHLFAHSIEAEYGFGDHLVVAGYADFEDPKGQNFNYTGARIEARYRFGERFDHFINTALYFEYILPDHAYSNSNEIEGKIILDKDLNDFRLVLNPGFSKYVSGDENKDIQPTFSAGMYYRRGTLMQPGIEFYENFTDKNPTIFPTIDFNLTGSIVWSVGAGFRLNDENDKVIFKSILQFDIQAISPTKLMRRKMPLSARM